MHTSRLINLSVVIMLCVYMYMHCCMCVYFMHRNVSTFFIRYI